MTEPNDITKPNAVTEPIVNFDPCESEYEDKEKIGDGLWVPCRICEQIFMRVRLTARYCGKCGFAFCEGEHGGFVQRGPALCVQCRTLTKK